MDECSAPKDLGTDQTLEVNKMLRSFVGVRLLRMTGASYLSDIGSKAAPRENNLVIPIDNHVTMCYYHITT